MRPLNNRVRAGDIFYIPACDISLKSGFVVARHIESISPNIGSLIEVFKGFYTEVPRQIDEVDLSQRLFRPIIWDMYFFKPFPRWRILFSDPLYDRSMSGYEDIGIAFDQALWLGGKSIKVTEPERLAYEPSICWSVENIIIRVIAHNIGVFKEDERYDYNRLPEYLKFNGGSYGVSEKVAKEVEDLFKDSIVKKT